MQRRTTNLGPWAMAFDYLTPGNPRFVREIGVAALAAAVLITFVDGDDDGTCPCCGVVYDPQLGCGCNR